MQITFANVLASLVNMCMKGKHLDELSIIESMD
jgi:hypothetical protein